MLSHPVAELMEKLWPATDPGDIYEAAERSRAVVERLSELQVVLAAVGRRLADTGDGRAVTAMKDHAHHLAGVDLTAVADRVGRQADAAHAYGDAVAQTQQRLTVIAAIADRDIVAGRVLEAATGDTTRLAGAQDAAARVMTAAAGDLEQRTRDITEDLRPLGDPGEQRGDGSGDRSGGAPMMAPMGGAMGGAMAGALAGALGHTGGPQHHSGTEIADVDLAMLRLRAAHLASTQPPEVAPWIRVAVGLGVAGDGRHVVVVGTSELGGYLRPGTAPEPHEVVVGDGRAPELAIMGYLRTHDLEPLAVLAATPPQPEVAAEMAEHGLGHLGIAQDGGRTEKDDAQDSAP